MAMKKRVKNKFQKKHFLQHCNYVQHQRGCEYIFLMAVS